MNNQKLDYGTLLSKVNALIEEKKLKAGFLCSKKPHKESLNHYVSVVMPLQPSANISLLESLL